MKLAKNSLVPRPSHVFQHTGEPWEGQGTRRGKDNRQRLEKNKYIGHVFVDQEKFSPTLKLTQICNHMLGNKEETIARARLLGEDQGSTQHNLTTDKWEREHKLSGRKCLVVVTFHTLPLPLSKILAKFRPTDRLIERGVQQNAS